jgi:hypothetical protein
VFEIVTHPMTVLRIVRVHGVEQKS